MGWGMSLLLALAVSIDGLSVGFSCGLRRLRIPFTSLLVISTLSAGAIALSMLAGSGIIRLVPLHCISAFGGAILIIFGLAVIRQYFTANGAGEVHMSGAGICEEKTEEAPHGCPRKISALLKRPEEADLDHSGTLSAVEALLLGSALAADAFAAGFGAALIGSPFLPTVFAVGLVKMILVPLGAVFGRVASRKEGPGYIPLLGGVILIFIGIMNLF